ncbi:MAG: hypothetical protein IJY04_10635 [Clostridia bacterium]|nr:hypothetical protein [Clostridia bacterium]
MIIEFNGLPGTGKTTVSRELGKRLSDRREVLYKLSPRGSRLKRYVSSVFDGSMTLYRLGAAFSDSVTGGADRENRRLAFVPVKYYRMYRDHTASSPENSVLLIDQGLIQGIISIAYGREIKDTAALDRLLEFLVKKGIRFNIVNGLGGAELARERIISRGATVGRLDVCDDGERRAVLAVQEKNFEIVRSRVQAIMKPVTVSIDTSSPAEENGIYIESELGI